MWRPPTERENQERENQRHASQVVSLLWLSSAVGGVVAVAWFFSLIDSSVLDGLAAWNKAPLETPPPPPSLFSLEAWFLWIDGPHPPREPPPPLFSLFSLEACIAATLLVIFWGWEFPWVAVTWLASASLALASLAFASLKLASLALVLLVAGLGLSLCGCVCVCVCVCVCLCVCMCMCV